MTHRNYQLRQIIEFWENPAWSNLLIVLPLALGAAWCTYQAGLYAAVARRQQTTTGTVISHEPSRHNRFGYRFSVAGRSHDGWDISQKGTLEIGKEVLVYYDPLDPETNSLADFADVQAREFGPVPFMLFGIGAIALFIFWRRRANRVSHEPQSTG